MKTIFIFRHAKAGWDDPSGRDFERTLNERGRGEASRMGSLLKDKALLPDHILCSTAHRAKETADLFMKAGAYEGAIDYKEEFYQAGPNNFIEIIKRLPEEFQSVMLIGHNPGMEEFANRFTDRTGKFPTAAIAHLEFPVNSWKDLSFSKEAKLINFWKP